MSRLSRFLAVLLVLLSLVLVPGPLVTRNARASTVLGGSYNFLVVDNARHRLYASNANGTVVVVNTDTNAFQKWIPVGTNPTGMDLAFNESELFVSVTGSSALAVINLTTDTVARSFNLAFSPGDVAAGRPGRAYVGNWGGWTYPEIVDTNTGRFIGHVTAAGAYYQDPVVRISRDRSTLFTVERWSAPTSIAAVSVLTDRPTYISGSPFGIDSAWDAYPSPDGTRLFYPNPAAYLVQDFLISNWSEQPHLNTGPYPYSVSLSDYGHVAFATAASQSTLWAFNATTGALLTTFPLSGDPGIVRSREDGTKAFVITASGLEIVATGFTSTTWPVPEPAIAANVTAGFLPLSVSFWSSVLGGKPPYTYTWTFGDGAAAYVADPTHVYPTAGTYSATLAVRDANGVTGSQTLDIRVGAPLQGGAFQFTMTIAGASFDPTTNPWVPPDPQVAAGPDHIVEMVNTRYVIWTRGGTQVGGGTLNSLFNAPTTDDLTDPRVQFDPFTLRFFASVADITRGSVLLAASAPVDPTFPWQVKELRSAAGCPDQPYLGTGMEVLVLSDGGYSSCSSTGTYVGGEYWVVNKMALLLGTLEAEHVGPDPALHTLFPAQVQSVSSDIYLVSVGWGWSPTNTLTLVRVSGSPPGGLVFSNRTLSVRTINQPPNADQPGTTMLVNTGDARVQDAFWRAGRLWVSLGDACYPAGSPANSSCARIIEVNTTAGTVEQDFEVSDPTAGVFYPAIAEDGAGDLFVSYGASSSTEYPDAVATAQIAGDAPNTTRAPKLVQAGTGPAAVACPDGVSCRYGDYFGASPDPLDPEAAWIVGEAQGASGWQTVVAQVGVFHPAVLNLSYAVTNGGTANPPPRLTFMSNGIQTTLSLSTSPQAYTADLGSAWEVSPLLLASSTERWLVQSPFLGIARNGTHEVVEYVHQFAVTLTATPAAGGTLSSASGWYNATAVLAVTATPAAGWKLDGWHGSGAGSYSGAPGTATVTISSAITETASFDAGLTITAGPGGSVLFEYANVSGLVAAGTTTTVYVPPGTTVRLTATGDSLDVFSTWQGNWTGPVPSISVNVTAPTSLQAHFSLSTTGVLVVGVGVALGAVVAAVVLVLLLRRRKARAPQPPPSGPTEAPKGQQSPPAPEAPKDPSPPGSPPP